MGGFLQIDSRLNEMNIDALNILINDRGNKYYYLDYRVRKGKLDTPINIEDYVLCINDPSISYVLNNSDCNFYGERKVLTDEEILSIEKGSIFVSNNVDVYIKLVRRKYNLECLVDEV